MTPDEENTWRALKDQEPVISSWLCRLGIHRWTRWSEPQYFSRFSSAEYYQFAYCVHCNSKRKKSTDSFIGKMNS